MRRPLLALALAGSAFLVTACATASPGWTFAPPTEPPAATPAPSGEAPSDAPPSDGGGAPGAVQVGALQIAFTVDEVSAPADAPFVIEFDNQDQGIPHNIEIKDASSATVFKGDLVTGPGKAQYEVPALAAGDYPFLCTVHPNMTGTLHVGS